MRTDESASDRKPPAHPWEAVPDALRARGMRWTPQRSRLIEVLAETDGHITATELVERCRAIDPSTIPSTVYRTLDVLEELGLVRHAHGAGGREEYHVLPGPAHGHLHCSTCGTTWELEGAEAVGLAQRLRASRGFEVDLSHVTIVGQCERCARREIEARVAAQETGQTTSPSVVDV
ncbi:MAG TPA: Fur family transcriptional regulator [Candidatus Limnocylindrales bacterium]